MKARAVTLYRHLLAACTQHTRGRGAARYRFACDTIHTTHYKRQNVNQKVEEGTGITIWIGNKKYLSTICV